jgi:short-subunit dehydrogenase
MREISGHTAILTGASSGIGPHIAHHLAREGVKVVLAARNAQNLRSIEREIVAAGGVARAIVTDITIEQDLTRLVEGACKIFGPPTVLVNNAAVELARQFHRFSDSDLELIVNVNLIAPMKLTKLVLPLMMQQRRGHVVNISSLAAKSGLPFDTPYAATKAAITCFTQSLRAEYRCSGISATAILPGLISQTGMFHRIQSATGMHPPALLGASSPESVAAAVVRGIKNDAPEIIVNRGPIRLLAALYELLPRLRERFTSVLGVEDLFKRAAEMAIVGLSSVDKGGP